MSGEERRQNLVDIIKNSPTPLSGTQLAKKLNVSRQIIVSDVALLRAANIDIISTNKGYIINTPVYCTRIFTVNHSDSQFEDELNTIIDAGGKVLDISIEHPVYGKISAPLEIYSRNDILKFKEKMLTDKAVPLCKITSGEHSHTVSAYSEDILNDVENSLQKKGYLNK